MLEENIELEEQKDSNRNDIEVDGQNQVVTDTVKSLIHVIITIKMINIQSLI